jgi:hypothetical protein
MNEVAAGRVRGPPVPDPHERPEPACYPAAGSPQPHAVMSVSGNDDIGLIVLQRPRDAVELFINGGDLAPECLNLSATSGLERTDGRAAV